MERLTYEKRPSSWNLGKYPTNYTSRHTFQEVVARLAAYEDTGLGPEEIAELSAAYVAAIYELAECRERDNERDKKCAPKCYLPDADGGCQYQVADGDDEPLDRCKRCPLCYVDKLRHKSPPNAPLTLEELREMDGEPVYLDFGDGGEWALVRTLQGKVFVVHKNAIPSPVNILFECGGKAYRRKPEECESVGN